MILKSVRKNQGVSRFNDSRDDKFFMFEEDEFYIPALPKIYETRSFKLDGHTISPHRLSCTCGKCQGVYVNLDNICDHLVKVLLSNYSHMLSGFQKELLKFISSGENIISGVKVLNNSTLGYVTARKTNRILYVEPGCESNFYIYFPESDSWKYGKNPH